MQSCIYDEIGRKYLIGDKQYYSVTTMLSNTGDKSNLDAWRKRLGAKQAARESQIASHVGTNLHNMCECYLADYPLKEYDWFTTRLFNQVKSLIDKRVTKCLHTEIFLYSDMLKLAGTADAIVYIDDRLTVLDFKTSKRKKRTEWMEDYFIQLAIYAWMYRERYGELPTVGALFFAHKIDIKPHEVYIDPTKYLGKAEDRMNQFRKVVSEFEKTKNLKLQDK